MAESNDNSNLKDDTSASRLPACDACKARKVKCDRKRPCASCVTSGVQCYTTHRPPEKRQRVHLSSKYDEAMASVLSELNQVSSTLEFLLAKLDISDRPPKSTSEVPIALNDSSRHESVSDAGDVDEAYEGLSSFNAQAREVTETLRLSYLSQNVTSVGSSPYDVTSPSQKLRDYVTTQGPSARATSSPKLVTISNYPEIQKVPLPKMDTVLRMLSLIKSHPQRFFSECYVVDHVSFANTCSKVYFPTEPASIYAWLMVNIGLGALFSECDTQHYGRLGITGRDVEVNVGLCKSNFELGIRCLPLLSECSREACQTLILAATSCMKLAKRSDAWALTVVAARMCLDLGLHHIPHGANDPEAAWKHSLFWYIYVHDRCLAVTIGRTPTLQDYDITTERPDSKDAPGVQEQFVIDFVNFATLEGQIYTQLFSACAQQESVHVRAERARMFAARLNEWRYSALTTEPISPKQEPLEKEMHLSFDIIKYGLLALIYRVIPPQTTNPHPLQYCDECIDAARKTLLCIVEAGTVIRAVGDAYWRMFLNWILLFVPFVSYIVIVGNTVATCSRSDLELLSKVVSNLESAADGAPATQQLYIACQRLYQVAELSLAESAARTTQPRFEQAPRQLHPEPSNTNAANSYNFNDAGYPDSFGQGKLDLSMSQQDWDAMMVPFDFGLAAETARGVTSYFEPYMRFDGHDGMP